MLTIEDVKTLTPGSILYHRNLKNSDGSPLRAKVNGIPKILVRKSRLGEFSIPLKHGLYDYGYADHTTAEHWCLDEDDAKYGLSEIYKDMKETGKAHFYVSPASQAEIDAYFAELKRQHPENYYYKERFLKITTGSGYTLFRAWRFYETGHNWRNISQLHVWFKDSEGHIWYGRNVGELPI